MEGAEEALRRVEALTASVEVGRIYDGRVTSIKDFGAFIEILPGKDGLCHISELADELRLQRGRRLQGRRRDAGQGHRHRRPGPREAQPQGRCCASRPPTARRGRRRRSDRRRRAANDGDAQRLRAAIASGRAVVTAGTRPRLWPQTLS